MTNMSGSKYAPSLATQNKVGLDLGGLFHPDISVILTGMETFSDVYPWCLGWSRAC